MALSAPLVPLATLVLTDSPEPRELLVPLVSLEPPDSPDPEEDLDPRALRELLVLEAFLEILVPLA